MSFFMCATNSCVAFFKSCVISDRRNRIFVVKLRKWKGDFNMELFSKSFMLIAVLIIIFFIIVAVLIGVIMLTIYKRNKANSSINTENISIETKKSLGEIIKNHRTNLNLSQEFVAESLGVSRQAVSKWETGKAEPSTSNLIALAKLFHVSLEELVTDIQK